MKPKINQNEKLIELFIFGIALVLAIIGVISVYSAGSYNAAIVKSQPFLYVIRQSLFLLLSLVAFVCCLKMKYKWFLDQNLQKRIIVGLVITLIGLFFVTSRNGSKGWFSLGVITIQPAEFAKLILIWLTATYFSITRYLPNLPTLDTATPLQRYVSDHHQELSIAIPYVSVLGLILLQPDTGSTMIMVMTLGLVWLASGIFDGKKALRYFSLFIASLISLAMLAIIVLGTNDYRVKRLISFINPFNKDVFDRTYQVRNSFYALARGGFAGVGIGNSVQKTGYLPENRTDFILAIIGEELGIIGVIIIIGLLLLLVYFIIKRSMTVQRRFDQIMLLGIGLLFFVQMIFNVGGITNLLPLTGVTLPFISYGGSSLLMSFIAIGLVLKISIYDRTTPLSINDDEVATQSSSKMNGENT